MQIEDEVVTLRARVTELEAALGLKNKTLRTQYRLTPALSDLLGLLSELPYVSDEIIKDRLHLAADSKVLVYRLRKELEGQDIEIHSRRGIGWYVDEPTRERLKQLTQEVTQQAA
jgi:hypothetical protein